MFKATTLIALSTITVFATELRTTRQLKPRASKLNPKARNKKAPKFNPPPPKSKKSKNTKRRKLRTQEPLSQLMKMC